MPLRQINNSNTDIAIMTILKPIIVPDTQLAASSVSGTGLELVFVQQRYQMSLVLKQGDVPIAVNISSGIPQEYTPEAQDAFIGLISIDISYYSKWSGQDEDIDTLWSDISADLERMKSNIEDNDQTEYQGTNHTINLGKTALSPYDEMLDDTIPGLSLIKRVMTLSYDILPYGS